MMCSLRGIMNRFNCGGNHESSENSQSTVENRGRNPPPSTLDFILDDVLKYLNKLEILCETKTEIENKCDIKEHDDCWSEDDINRAWEETQRIDDTLGRIYQALVIVLQILKRQRTKEEESDLNEGRHLVQRCAELSLSDTPDQMKAERENGRGEDVIWSTVDRNGASGEERSSQSSDELETLGAAGGVEQMTGARNKVSKVSSHLKEKNKKNKDSKGSGERDDSNASKMFTRSQSNKSNSQTVYIRIPFSVMSGNESPSSIDTVFKNKSPTYKLIDRVPNLTEIRKRKSYALLYNNQTKNAAWVYEILNSETLKQEVTRDNDKFSVDQSIHLFYQASSEKYTGPYDRGHLAAVDNHRWCQEALDDTFLMSNISPQNEDLNNGKWKSLEAECQRKAKENYIRNVHVYSGPLYLPRGVVKYNEKGQAVPTHFFKVIIVELRDRVELECYKMPNEKLEGNLDEYEVSIEEIEKASGLIFRENSCSKGETDSDREITWTGEYGETCTFKTQVKISTQFL